MISILAAAVVLAAALCAARFGFGSKNSQTDVAQSDGPVTLEELFEARYARGEIDLLQYRMALGQVATQLRTTLDDLPLNTLLALSPQVPRLLGQPK